MAGHNKWSKVKHIKARVDVIRGKVFSKCSHEISIAARDGGGDPSTNARLRSAIESAKAASMPKEKIERAIKKGTGELGGEMIQEASYEGYGTQGVAYLIEAATDNLNRTAADIRTIFTKNGGSVASPGSVAYQFDRLGEITLPAGEHDAETVMDAAILAGAQDVRSDSDEHLVLTLPADLAAVADRLREQGLEPASQKLVAVPQTPLVIEDLEQARKAVRLYELLDEYQDTLNVFTNFELSDEVLAGLDA